MAAVEDVESVGWKRDSWFAAFPSESKTELLAEYGRPASRNTHERYFIEAAGAHEDAAREDNTQWAGTDRDFGTGSLSRPSENPAEGGKCQDITREAIVETPESSKHESIGWRNATREGPSGASLAEYDASPAWQLFPERRKRRERAEAAGGGDEGGRLRPCVPSTAAAIPSEPHRQRRRHRRALWESKR